MTNHPMTRAEAETRRYDNTGINEGGSAYNPGRCAAEVYGLHGWHYYQCARRPGKGPDGLYCTQHARIVEARRDSTA